MSTPLARRARHRAALAVVAAAATLIACESRQDPIAAFLAANATDGSGTSGTISLTPASTSLAVGRTAQLTLSATSTLRPVFFRSETPNVATVSATGLVTAIAAGTATISAISSVDTTRRATTTVRVTGPTTTGTTSTGTGTTGTTGTAGTTGTR